ncbi:MAG: NUDIX domain-containing protein [Ectothiorhodospiraceae bacterium]|nr:NUDIX domain-containing protein [Ectothiorhodospiraceae bacterium]MCH8506860.1 NUDIX domain-containing protein [Ectothiorhodospiraceae bacterium]
MRFCPMCSAALEPVELGGYPRLRCEAQCGFVHWGNPTPVVAAIVEYEGKVLLARNVAWPEKWYALITGFLEREETPEQGVLREVQEELGLDGRIREFVGHYTFPEQNQIICVYHVEAAGEVVLNEELAEYRLFAHEDVRTWPRGTGPALRDWLDRKLGRVDASMRIDGATTGDEP